MRLPLLYTIFAFCFFLSFNSNLVGQVTIGNNEKPEKAGILEIKSQGPDGNNITSTKGGLILPRVLLENPSTMEPFVSTSESDYDTQKRLNTGTLVYNLTDDVYFCPGPYVWNSDQWAKLGIPCPELPNSYFVLPGETYTFPVKKPYVVWNNRSDLTPFNNSDKLFAELLWQDTTGLISSVTFEDGDQGIASKIKVTASNQSGNALVALHIGPNGDKSDPIYWSWHIWVTDYNPDKGGTSYPHNNGEAEYVFMDRNLGATTVSPTDGNSMGLLYQWGRKDPFTASSQFWNTTNPKKIYDINDVELTELNELEDGADGTGIKHAPAPDVNSNLAISIYNPTTLYYGPTTASSNNFDWYNGNSTTGDDNLWNTAEGQKSYFDPCPQGWRIPANSATKSPWAKFLDSGSGWDPSPPSYYIQDSSGNGVNFGAPDASSSPLGFYPYGFLRVPIAYVSGSVGGGYNYPGGSIGWGVVEVNRPNGFYWSGSPAGGNGAAKLMFMDYDTMLGSGAYAKEQTTAKSTGASVRCVKK